MIANTKSEMVNANAVWVHLRVFNLDLGNLVYLEKLGRVFLRFPFGFLSICHFDHLLYR